MTRTRPIATAALALGAFAVSALQSTPADAFPGSLKITGEGGNHVHTVAGRPGGSAGVGPKGYTPFNPGSFPTSNGGAGKFGSVISHKNPSAFDPYKAPGGNSGKGKLPTPTGSQGNPGVFDPNQYRPPFGASDGPSKFPTPTTSHKNPGVFDPYNVPGGNPGGGNLPPIGGSMPNPNVPGGNPGGGNNLPPIVGNLPNPNLPWGNPGNGGGKKGPHGYGYNGVYVEVGGDGDGYNPCWWLRRKFRVTGNVYWLNRYRHCLWRNYVD